MPAILLHILQNPAFKGFFLFGSSSSTLYIVYNTVHTWIHFGVAHTPCIFCAFNLPSSFLVPKRERERGSELLAGENLSLLYWIWIAIPMKSRADKRYHTLSIFFLNLWLSWARTWTYTSYIFEYARTIAYLVMNISTYIAFISVIAWMGSLILHWSIFIQFIHLLHLREKNIKCLCIDS